MGKTMRSGKRVKTLTINETLDLFHYYGVPMSYETLTKMIDGDRVPWAVSARSGGAGRVMRVIFRKPLMAWLDELAEEMDVEEEEATA